MTEKNYNPEQKNAKAMAQQRKAVKQAVETPKEIVKDVKESGVPEEVAKKEEKLNEKEQKEKTETKKEEKKKSEKRVKKDFAIVNAYSLPISTKDSMALCKFVKRKNMDVAIKELEEVVKLKKPVKAKGEYSHKRGKGISSAIYPKKAAQNFIKILKTLKGNANYNGVENPIIVEAKANMASRPSGRFGRYRRKRTHLTIKVNEMKVGGKK